MASPTGLDPNNTITSNPQYNKSIFERFGCLGPAIRVIAKVVCLEDELNADQARWHTLEAERIAKLEANEQPTADKVETLPDVVDLTGEEPATETHAEEKVSAQAYQTDATATTFGAADTTFGAADTTFGAADTTFDAPDTTFGAADTTAPAPANAQAPATNTQAYGPITATLSASTEATVLITPQSTQPTVALTQDPDQLDDLDLLDPELDLRADDDPLTPIPAQPQDDDFAFLGSAAPTDGEESDTTDVDESQQSLNLSQRGMENSELSIHGTPYTVYALGNVAIKELATDQQKSDLRFQINESDMLETIQKLNRHAPEGASHFLISCSIKGRVAVYEVISYDYKYRNAGIQFKDGVESARLTMNGVKKRYDFVLLGFAD